MSAPSLLQRLSGHATMAAMRLLAHLPLPLLRALGNVLGRVLYVLARPRRRVALTNLRLCFPQWDAAQRRAVARQSFVTFTQSVLDRAWIWHAPEALVRRRITITGAIDELRKPEAAILLAPHFYGMDAGGTAIMQQLVRVGGSIYSPQKNPVLDAWVRAGRTRFGDVVLINRQSGVKPVIQSLRAGRYLYLLPDMDLGPHESLFVPFFGVPAATVPALPRLARLGRARVVPTITRMTPTGYVVEVHPAWPNYPSNDLQADTAQMNQQLEEWIRTMPEQYYWVHKRFKTRPPGQPSVY